MFWIQYETPICSKNILPENRYSAKTKIRYEKYIYTYVYNIHYIYCAIMSKKELFQRNIYFAYLYNIDVTFRKYLLFSWQLLILQFNLDM